MGYNGIQNGGADGWAMQAGRWAGRQDIMLNLTHDMMDCACKTGHRMMHSTMQTVTSYSTDGWMDE